LFFLVIFIAAFVLGLWLRPRAALALIAALVVLIAVGGPLGWFASPDTPSLGEALLFLGTPAVGLAYAAGVSARLRDCWVRPALQQSMLVGVRTSRDPQCSLSLSE
jgi:hypothetical protein